MRKRLLLVAALAIFAANAATSDQRIRHVLNRLTFGPRPGDIETVRKLGVDKWIELQLHPERIAENPLLESRLKPLDSLRLGPAEILAKYFPQYPPGFQPSRLNLNELLPGEQFRKVLNGTAEERRAAIMALDPEKRSRVLAAVPPNVVEGLPDLQKEQVAARQKQQEERQMEMRRLRPPLNELLEPRQIQVALHGTAEQRALLFSSLDAAKLQQIVAVLPPDALAGQPDLRRAGAMSRSPQQVVIGDLREAKLYRALFSNRQLEEILADFWFNHFNIFEGKDRVLALLPSYERDAIRPHVLGKFRDLLLATARHPAMLYYLDNWESMSPDVFQIGPFAPGPFTPAQQLARQARGLNENYGRELLELHTLGVNGGFTQQDVIAVARCFTGWTIRQPNQKPEFAFAAFMHDTAEKTVLGHQIPAGGGEQDALQVIDILARHPSTARFISTKLARRFVADDPPSVLIEHMARTYLKTDGDLRAVLETMFTSREFFSEEARQSKIKSPLELVVSAARSLDAQPTDTFALVQKIADMGEPLYAREAPNGYKDTRDAWLSTAGVLARVEFTTALLNGQIPGVPVDTSRFAGKDAAAISRELLNGDPSAQTLAAMEQGLRGRQPLPALIAGLVLSSPEFQRR